MGRPAPQQPTAQPALLGVALSGYLVQAVGGVPHPIRCGRCTARPLGLGWRASQPCLLSCAGVSGG